MNTQVNSKEAAKLIQEYDPIKSSLSMARTLHGKMMEDFQENFSMPMFYSGIQMWLGLFLPFLPRQAPKD